MSTPSTPANTPKTYSFGQRLGMFFRCASNACPRCRHRPIASLFGFHKTCPNCGLVIDKGNGFLLGALPVSYAIFVVLWLIPLLIAWLTKIVSYEMAFGLIIVGGIVWPILLHNSCKMISLGGYYFFMIKELDEG